MAQVTTSTANGLHRLDNGAADRARHCLLQFDPKPIPYFFPMLDVLEGARAVARPPYTARIFVDGIDRKKAGELTNVLRARGISLELVRSRRDESEPIIRLADMWAGCLRAAFAGAHEERVLIDRALSTGYLRPAKEKAP